MGVVVVHYGHQCERCVPSYSCLRKSLTVYLRGSVFVMQLIVTDSTPSCVVELQSVLC